MFVAFEIHCRIAGKIFPFTYDAVETRDVIWAPQWTPLKWFRRMSLSLGVFGCVYDNIMVKLMNMCHHDDMIVHVNTVKQVLTAFYFV